MASTPLMFEITMTEYSLELKVYAACPSITLRLPHADNLPSHGFSVSFSSPEANPVTRPTLSHLKPAPTRITLMKIDARVCIHPHILLVMFNIYVFIL